MKRFLFAKTLVIGIVILFISIGVVSAFNVSKFESFNSKILYVGGSGPGNYTLIQSAIDAADSGDTIFVYDDSSPYYENIVIQKSIELIGEARETTFILGNEISDGVIVNISADDVSISGFTIQPQLDKPVGIIVNKNYVYPDYWNIDVIQNIFIFNNIIKNTGKGIFAIRLINGNIYGNIIENCDGSGIVFFISSNNTIENNVISNCYYRGIEISGLWSPFRIKNYKNPKSENNVISHNTINSNRWGLGLYSGPISTIISDNNITNNHGIFPGNDGIGINIYQASKTQIIRNNFIDNSQNAYFEVACIIRYPQFIKNYWKNNYWGELKNNHAQINGMYLIISFPRLPFSISFPNYDFNFHEVPGLAFDRQPANEPYDI